LVSTFCDSRRDVDFIRDISNEAKAATAAATAEGADQALAFSRIIVDCPSTFCIISRVEEKAKEEIACRSLVATHLKLSQKRM
jgi:hypothetical protein